MIDKKYDHLSVEKDKYEEWKKNGYFEANNGNKESYCIVLPPPNVTGKLHIGHAYDVALQDIRECKAIILYGYQEWTMLLSQQKLK